MANTDTGTIKEEEKKILEEAEKIESAETTIKQEEKQIEDAEEEILKDSKNKAGGVFGVEKGVTQRELQIFRLLWVKKLDRHKLLSALMIVSASVLIWRGIWHTIDEIPVLSYSLVSLGVGILLVWILRKYKNIF